MARVPPPGLGLCVSRELGEETALLGPRTCPRGLAPPLTVAVRSLPRRVPPMLSSAAGFPELICEAWVVSIRQHDG